MPPGAPPWAAALFQELHRARCEIEALRASIGMHVVDRREAKMKERYDGTAVVIRAVSFPVVKALPKERAA